MPLRQSPGTSTFRTPSCFSVELAETCAACHAITSEAVSATCLPTIARPEAGRRTGSQLTTFTVIEHQIFTIHKTSLDPQRKNRCSDTCIYQILTLPGTDQYAPIVDFIPDWACQTSAIAMHSAGQKVKLHFFPPQFPLPSGSFMDAILHLHIGFLCNGVLTSDLIRSLPLSSGKSCHRCSSPTSKDRSSVSKTRLVRRYPPLPLHVSMRFGRYFPSRSSVVASCSTNHPILSIPGGLVQASRP